MLPKVGSKNRAISGPADGRYKYAVVALKCNEGKDCGKFENWEEVHMFSFNLNDKDNKDFEEKFKKKVINFTTDLKQEEPLNKSQSPEDTPLNSASPERINNPSQQQQQDAARREAQVERDSGVAKGGKRKRTKKRRPRKKRRPTKKR